MRAFTQHLALLHNCNPTLLGLSYLKLISQMHALPGKSPLSSIGTLLCTFQSIFSQGLYYYLYATNKLVDDLPKITSLLVAKPYLAYLGKMSRLKNGMPSNIK